MPDKASRSVDLPIYGQGRMYVPLSRPEITEQDVQAVCQVLAGNQLSLGPTLAAFERAMANYTGRRYGVGVNSGTSGLLVALKALGIGPADEVVTTGFTFVASVTAIMIAGARPVFADIDPLTLNLDCRAVEEAITPRTRGILAVEVFGNPAGMDRIAQTATRLGLPLIEDSCEALGSSLSGRKAGSFGMVSVFGFYPNKQITTGEGGMILTDEEQRADLCLSLRNQGRPARGNKMLHLRLGYNFRLSDINAALGLAQLARIDQIRARRAALVGYYRQILSGDDRIATPFEPEGCQTCWFAFVIRLQDPALARQRDRIIEVLAQEGIQAATYFPPAHLQPVVAQALGCRDGMLPVCEQVGRETIALPLFNQMTTGQVEYVCRSLRRAMDQVRRPLVAV